MNSKSSDLAFLNFMDNLLAGSMLHIVVNGKEDPIRA